MKLLDKDVLASNNTYYGCVSLDLTHELSLLCKGQVLDSQNVVQLFVEDMAAQRRQVRELVEKHKRRRRKQSKRTLRPRKRRKLPFRNTSSKNLRGAREHPLRLIVGLRFHMPTQVSWAMAKVVTAKLGCR